MAIDQAMSVFPKDRLSSADEWMEKIDTIRRQKRALAQAKKDKQVEANIQELIAMTNSGDAPEAAAPIRQMKQQDAIKRPHAASFPNDAPDQPQRKPSFFARLFARPKAHKPGANGAHGPNY